VIIMSIVDHSLLGYLYDETIGFRRLTGSPYAFDVQQYERYYLVRVARSLYYVSPIIRKIIDKPIMLFLENGLDIEFESDKVRNAFEEYISYLPYTFCFENLIELYLRAFCVDGELFIPLIRHKNNAIEFGYIPADMVLNVYHDENNGMVFSDIEYMIPSFSKDSVGYYYEVSSKTNRSKIARIYKTKKSIDIDGEVLYYALNNFPFMRGRSLIETVMDYAYAFDEFVTDRLRRQKLANTFIWDVEIQGAERETIKRRIEEFRREPFPSSGGVRFHNEKEKWSIITPNLQSEDAQKDSEIVLSHIANGNWIISKSELGLDGGSEENELVSRYVNYVINRVFKQVVCGIVDTVLYSAQNVGLLPKYNLSLEYEIGYNKYQTEMIRHISVSLYQTISALKIARERGWIEDKEATEIISNIVNKKLEKKDVKSININEVNAIITTVVRALGAGLISEEQAKEIIEHYIDKSEYEWIGGGKNIDMRGRVNKGERNYSPNLPVSEKVAGG
jgi:hypothetical protein